MLGTATPYEQLGFLRRLWLRRFPHKMTIAGSVNDHALCVGISGTGKSNLMEVMAEEDALAHGVIVIDTHHDSFDAILKWCVRCKDPSEVVIIDPTTHRYGVPKLTLLDYEHPENYVTIDSLLSAFRNMPNWKLSFGERMADVLRNLFLALQKSGTPFTAATRFLTSLPYRKLIIDRAGDPELDDYFEHLQKMPDSRMVIESSRNKLNQLIANPLIRPMFDSTEASLSFFDAMNDKTVLINLSQNYFKDESRGLLGSLLFFLIYEALIARESLKERRPVSIYCDEFQQYAIPDFFLPILTGGRKYGAGLKMYSQTLESFQSHEANVIMATVGTIIAFSVSHRDAQTLAPNMFSYFGELVKSREGRDLYGAWGKTEYYGVGDESRNSINELCTQIRGECLIRVKGEKRIKIWAVDVAKAPRVEISDAELDAFRKESAKHYCV